jgi:hypothetical protein
MATFWAIAPALKASRLAMAVASKNCFFMIK